MNINEYQLKKFNKVSFEINDELKEIIYNELKEAQGFDSPFHLSKTSHYDYFHVKLENYFNKNDVNKKPNKTDYLAWILLLTYPPDKIRCFENFTDLNIDFKNKISHESDFEIIELLEKGDYMATNHTCICSQPIENICRLKNKFSDVNIQLGCDCIERYGLVSKTEINECKKKMKEKKERNKERNTEIEEGKPEGFYENERQLKKREKEENKLKKIEEKEKKKMEKELKKLNKEKNTHYKFKIKKCLFCNKDGIYKEKYYVTTYGFGICSSCVPSNIGTKKENLNYYIKNNSVYNDCLCCGTMFVNLNKKEIKELCNNCKLIWTLEKCKMCPKKFLKQKEENDLYCLDCDDKITSCIDCQQKILKPNERCKVCDYRFTNKLTIIFCQSCDEEVEIKENEKWRKFCSDCFKKNLTYFNCIKCDIPFKRLTSDTWRKSCSDCYHKSK